MSRRDQSGATLIESLITIVILGIVLATSSSLFAFGTRVVSRESVAVVLQEELVGAKNMLLDDLSIAGYRPDDLIASAAGPFASLPSSDVFDVVNPGASTTLSVFNDLDFRGDVDSDGDTDRICYRLVSGELRRRIVDDVTADCSTATEELLLSNVTALEVQLLDANRTVLTKQDVEDGDPKARFAQVTIALQNTVKGGAVSRRARGETAVRN